MSERPKQKRKLKTLEPDVELKLRRQYSKPFRSDQHLVPVSEVLKRPPGDLNVSEIGQRFDRLLEHLKSNSERVKADNRTGELVFDGKLVPGSDVRRLFGDVVARKEKVIKPRGWEQLRDVLEFTHAPEDVLGQDWDKVNKRVDLEKKANDETEFQKARPDTRQGVKDKEDFFVKKPRKPKFKPTAWQSL